MPHTAQHPNQTVGSRHAVLRALRGWAALTAMLLATSAAYSASMGSGRATPRIFTSAWGTHGASSCPGSDETGLDNMPVTFNWFIEPSSVQASDFIVVNEDGSIRQPVCALQYPPNESDEWQTVNLIGDFGDPVDGQRPQKVKVVGQLKGKPPGASRWRPMTGLSPKRITQLEASPFMVDAWILTPELYADDPNRCTTGETFVRVMWSNGITAYPTGEEVGEAVVASYRAIFRLPSGKRIKVTPLAVGDLYDHATAIMADNMHDLCLPAVPAHARLLGISIDGELVQDPNGDPNQAQTFLLQNRR